MQEDVSMDEIQKTLLMQVADLHEVPAGAYLTDLKGCIFMAFSYVI